MVVTLLASLICFVLEQFLFNALISHLVNRNMHPYKKELVYNNARRTVMHKFLLLSN